MLKPDFFSLTGLAVCTPFLSSARMQLLLEAGIAVGFLIFQLSDFLRQNATFVFAENKCKCICQAVHFIFLLCRGQSKWGQTIFGSSKSGRFHLGCIKSCGNLPMHEKRGDAGDIITANFLDFPPNFRLRTRFQAILGDFRPFLAKFSANFFGQNRHHRHKSPFSHVWVKYYLFRDY